MCVVWVWGTELSTKHPYLLSQLHPGVFFCCFFFFLLLFSFPSSSSLLLMLPRPASDPTVADDNVEFLLFLSNAGITGMCHNA